MTSALAWHISRAGGLVGWALLTASTLWGLALSTRLFGKRPRPAWLLDLHRFLGGLALIFIGVHIAGTLLDATIHFGPASVLVPFASPWRPTAVAWGVVSLYLVAAVELTSLARRHLPNRIWRRIHVLAFPLFVTATVHGITAGTDVHTMVAGGAVVTAFVAVGALVGVRLTRRPPVRPQTPGRTPVASGARRPA